MPKPFRLVGAAPVAGANGRALFEQCYGTAELPLSAEAANVSGWRLVDDGDASKGVSKPGWASSAEGQKLALGPLHGPRNESCALLRVKLGYLLKRDPAQGGLHVGCSGCACQQLQDRGTHYTYLPGWGKAAHNEMPFPSIQTDAALASDPALRRNFTVSAAMQFLLLWRSASPCVLEVTHIRRPGGRARRVGATRVRVDSLELQQVRIDSFVAKVLSAPRKMHGAVAFAHRSLNCSTAR